MFAAGNSKIDRDLVDMSMDKRFYSRYFSGTILPADMAQHYIDIGWKQGLDPTPWFSSGQYINRHPELVGGSISPFVHYLIGNEGFLPAQDTRENDDLNLISSEFDPEFYVVQLGLGAGKSPPDPARDYLRHGWKRGLNPVQWFAGQAYLEANPDVAEAGLNPFVHYIRSGRNEARPLPVPVILNTGAGEMVLLRRSFDSVYYRQQLVRSGISAGGDLVQHYLDVGWKLGLDPVNWFSTHAYLAANADVAAAGVNPFVHYLGSGQAEGRLPKGGKADLRVAVPVPADPAPAPQVVADVEPASPVRAEAPAPNAYDPYVRSKIAEEFNREFYLSTYPDIAAAGVDPLDHYILQGWKEGRDPTPSFSTQHYVDANPDVIDAGLHPFFHYIIAGRTEGRAPRHELGFRFDILRQLKSPSEQLLTIKAHAVRHPPGAVEDLRAVLMEFFDRASKFVLSFSHDDFTANLGGVQLMLRREMKELAADGYEHINLFPAIALPFIEPSDTNLVLGLTLNGKLKGYFSARDVAGVLGEFANHVKEKPSHFVVHHLLGHNLSAVVSILRALGFKEGYYWLHDYAALYNKWNLMRNDVKYGGPPKKGSRAYELCIYGQAEFDHAKEYAQLFDNFTVHLISPSQAALDIWVKSDVQRTASATVLPHCELVAARPAPFIHRKNSAKLRMGYLGFPANHKGWPVFRDLALQFAEDDRYEFHYLGMGCPAGLPITYHEVSASERDPYVMRDAIMAAGLDVAFVWSLCPETFSLVAYEALAGGALLIANPDGGNIPATINRRNCGLVIEDEKALPDLMKEGAFLHMSRSRRDTSIYDLSFSRMLASILASNA